MLTNELWAIEGIGKLVLFGSFWFLAPAVVGVERLRNFTVRSLTRLSALVLAPILLYAVGFAGVFIDGYLPVQFRFTPATPGRPEPLTPEQIARIEAENQRRKEAAAKFGLEGLTVSPILVESDRYAKWHERHKELNRNRAIAIAIMLGFVAIVVMMSRSAVEKYWVTPLLESPPIEPPTEPEIISRLAVIGAGLFCIGSTLDFIKWISSCPGS